MTRKRKEYQEYVQQYYNTDSRINEDGTVDNMSSHAITEEEIAMRRQVLPQEPSTGLWIVIPVAGALSVLLTRPRAWAVAVWNGP